MMPSDLPRSPTATSAVDVGRFAWHRLPSAVRNEASRSRVQSAPLKIIGFLVDWIDGAYQNQILQGARDAARDRNIHLLCFAGGILGSDLRGGARRNQTFELANELTVDGLILLSGTIGNQIGAPGLLEYCARFGRQPCVSVAVELPGMASVVVDNRTGIERAISHLIRTHGCQRIAFVRGPEHNLEAELRCEVYRAALLAHGLGSDDRLVVNGDFLIESGRRAVATLFDVNRAAPQAIVCANDQMAVGVVQALAARNLRVPDDVLVVGFDDIEEARFTSPPLTTVRQPLYEQGREAVRLVASALYGGDRAERVTLHTELIVRRSCGCSAEQSQILLPALPKRVSFEAAVVERRQILLADMSRAARGSYGILGSGWDARLVGALSADLRGDSSTAFVSSVEQSLLALLDHKADFNPFHDVLSALRRHMLACLEMDHERRALAEDLFQQARMLIGQVSERAQAQQKLWTSRWTVALSQTTAALISSVDLADLQAAVSERFPELTIRSCFVCLYADPATAQQRLAIAYTEGRAFEAHAAAAARRADLPRWLLDNGTADGFYIATLYTDERVLGYVLLDLSAREGLVYEALREFLSAAVRSITSNALSVRSV